MQWTGYYAAMASEPVYVQLAFIDVGATTEASFNELTIVGDDLEAPVKIDTVTPNSPPVEGEGGPSLITVLAHAEGLPVGVHHFDRIRYTDEGGQPRELQVGEWEIDVRDGPVSDALVELESSVGATAFGVLEVLFESNNDDTLTITGLDEVRLPGVPVTVSMALSDNHSAPGADPSAPPASSEVRPVGAVTLGPGDQARIAFTLNPAADTKPRFAVVRPMLLYMEEGASGSSSIGVSMQVYSAPFMSTAEMTHYLELLPTGASHSLSH